LRERKPNESIDCFALIHRNGGHRHHGVVIIEHGILYEKFISFVFEQKKNNEFSSRLFTIGFTRTFIVIFIK